MDFIDYKAKHYTLRRMAYFLQMKECYVHKKEIICGIQNRMLQYNEQKFKEIYIEFRITSKTT